MSWAENFTACAFDLETDGKDPDDARIVTAAAIGVGGGRPTTPATFVLKPTRPIPDEAAAIHGYTTERAEAEGTDPAEAVNLIAGELVMAMIRDIPVVAYNAVYDMSCLARELERHQLPSLVERLDGKPMLILCPLIVDKACDKFRRGSRRLLDTAKHYSIDLAEEDAHDSTADALTAARVAWRLSQLATQPKVRVAFGCKPEVAEKYAALGSLSIHDMQQWQKDQAAAQAKSLKAYFTKAGKASDAASVRPDWPIRKVKP